MTEETCPGCGAPVWTRIGDETIFVCDTGADAGYFGRECWANQCVQAQDRLAEAEVTFFNEGIEAVAKIFDQQEIFHYKVATWDRTQIVQGSKYNVPTNGPAIVCAGAEKRAKQIRGMKKTYLRTKFIRGLGQEIPEPEGKWDGAQTQKEKP